MPNKSAVTPGAETFPVKVIVTHHRPHFDEILAIFVLWAAELAWRLFPGIESAVVKYWDAGTKTPDGRTAEEWLRESQTLCVGVGDGPFNEHPTEEKRREKGECAATLVARGVGVDQVEKLLPLLAYARRVDLESVGNPDDLSLAIKRMHLCPLFRAQQVLDWAFLAIRVTYEESPRSGKFTTAVISKLIKKQFPDHLAAWEKQLADLVEWEKKVWTEAAAEFKKKAKIVRYTGLDYRGQPKSGLKIVAVKSDNPVMAKYVRSKEVADIDGKDLRADITIIQRSTGHVAILGNQHRLDDVAKAVKTAEMLSRLEDPPSWNKRGAEGTDSVWHYAPDGEFLLNGSNTTKSLDETALTLDEIVELVRLALSVTEFEACHAPKCHEGCCTATRRSPCSWYKYGLTRCINIRVTAAKARAEAT